MALSKDNIKQLIELSGYKPTGDELEATTSLHETLTEQLGNLPDESLDAVEPYYIQPTRK